MKTRVLIEVSGGVVQEVTTNGDVEVILVDWDNAEDSPSVAAEDFPLSLSTTELANDKFSSYLETLKEEIGEMVEKTNET